MSTEQENSLQILNPPSHYEIRKEFVDILMKDLLGPAEGEQEEITENKVRDRYLVGMLAPSSVSIDDDFVGQDELTSNEDSVQDGIADLSVHAGDTIFPSCFGMSFTVSAEAKSFVITAEWGKYERADSEYLINEETQKAKKVWKRIPIKAKSSPFNLKEGKITSWKPNPEQTDVYVKGIIRKLDSVWVVSLFLVNGQEETENLKDQMWLFQTKLSVESPDQQAVFRKHYQRRDQDKIDRAFYAEEEAMNMAYRHCVEFAVGHGVAVHAEILPDNPLLATKISTAAIPMYEVEKHTPPLVNDIPALEGLVLDMKELSEASDNDLVKMLEPLPYAYEAWIKEQYEKINNPTEDLKEFIESANAALKNCSEALIRIKEGIALLKINPDAAEAFRFTNKSMWLQRIRSIYSLLSRRDDNPEMDNIDKPENRSWYPFQLAFVLVNLPSITDVHHEDRSHESKAIADLLWFPTGGGKTEAYLGLTAYTIAIRRLQGEISGYSGNYGIAVLMRYTLRLLTLQQFQRAAALICACESIRRENPKKWGGEPFRIGLWVGQKTTPNTTEQSDEAIKIGHGNVNRQTNFGGGSPHQLTNCPWCGAKIDEGKNIIVDKDRRRTFIYCGDKYGTCLFTPKNSPNEGLPVLVVDEEIYRLLPALLIATVDKFAQMPWNGKIQMLFGKVNGYCERHGFRSPEIEDSDSHPKRGNLPSAKTIPCSDLRPPDLIIQDELHLISGPLGTLVGLYETAIDELCCWYVDGKRIRPKVVASTATIRNANDQVHSLFLRQVKIFPPQALDVRDNFFSRQRKSSEKVPGRLYMGVCAPGKRIKATSIRIYLTFLATAQLLYEKYGKAADPWMTLVGYFNSMKELGGMRRLVLDDIMTRLRRMDRRALANRYLKVHRIEELTSRKSARDIPYILDRLEVEFDPVQEQEAKERFKQGLKQEKADTIDVLLATNMVSVGVDVGRLGLMVVNSQPKTTAEYIQATSRVGRKHPGVVCTVYNWARPRDFSHYECFEHYHATFYKQVEALSVTPFAERAMDRGLSALLISLIRLSKDDYNSNKSCENIDRNDEVIKQAINTILNRAEFVKGDKETKESVNRRLKHLMDEWVKLAKYSPDGRRLGYQDENDGVTLGLLKSAGLSSWEEFTCLSSLRDVEPMVDLILDDRGLDDYEEIPFSLTGGAKA